MHPIVFAVRPLFFSDVFNLGWHAYGKLHSCHWGGSWELHGDCYNERGG